MSPLAPRVLVADQTLVEGRFRPEIAVQVDGGLITAVGPASALAPDAPVERLVGRPLVPGTLNAHNHSFQSMLRGGADDCGFLTWPARPPYAYPPPLAAEPNTQAARFSSAR